MLVENSITGSYVPEHCLGNTTERSSKAGKAAKLQQHCAGCKSRWSGAWPNSLHVVQALFCNVFSIVELGCKLQLLKSQVFYIQLIASVLTVELVATLQSAKLCFRLGPSYPN
jgi:hypothetical protein